MYRIEKSRKHFWRNMFTRIALVLVTVTVIVWSLPRNEGQRFYDKTVEKKQVSKFLSDFHDGIPGLPHQYIDIIAKQLHRLYQTGIMDTPEYNEIYRDSTSLVRVVIGNNAQTMPLNEIYSTLSAYEQIFLDDVVAQQRPLLQRCNLNNYIEPNLIYDKERSLTERNDLLSSIPPASGMVMSGQKVIDRGDIVDEYTYRVLNSFEREIKRRSATQNEITSTIIGQIILVTLMVTLFTIYLALFRRDYFNKPRSIAMLYSLITLFPVIVAIMMRHNFLSVYIVPFAMVPMFVRVFMDSRTAFISHVTMLLICTIAVRYQYEFIIIQIVAGLIAIYSLRELTRRAQVFKTGILVAMGSALVYLALQMIQDNDFTIMDHDMYYHFVVNGVLLLLAYPLMYIVEKMFGFVSSVTLFELSNTNRGLLRDLSEIAPGTFQHSITVGNLAAEIANKIGANSLLVRTGALYHDIGKMADPVFFTENQAGVNPHDHLDYKESARIIINHVTEGVKMAERENLPTIIRDFIVTHHGTGMTKFFYIKYKNEHPDEEIDPKPFEYPGPNPFTREQAILMIADGVEAASRSITEYTEENIATLVNKIIDGDVADGYFKDCPITFRDIALAKIVLIERLKAIYHTRISYPEAKK